MLSFVNIGIYWNNHHHLLKTIDKVTGAMLWSNLNLLFWISLFPFTTAWMSEHGFAKDTVATYGIVLAFAAIAYTILQTVIVASQGSDSRLKEALGNDVKAKMSLVSYLVSIPLAFALRWVSVGIFVAVAVTWLIPDRRLSQYIATSRGDDATN